MPEPLLCSASQRLNDENAYIESLLPRQGGMKDESAANRTATANAAKTATAGNMNRDGL